MEASEEALLEAQDLELQGVDSGSFSFRVSGSSLACPEQAGHLVDAIFDPQLIVKGSLKLGGTQVSECLSRGRAGLAPTRLPVPDSARVGKTLLMSARLIGWGKREVDEALERCGISRLTKRHLKGLSALEHRLVGLAHGITGNPSILVLAELFDELDPAASLHLLSVLEPILEGRRWVAQTRDNVTPSLQLSLRAQQVISRTTKSPEAALAFVPETYWVRSDDPLTALACELEKRGAKVATGPHLLSLLVRNQRAQDIFAEALKLGISLTEMSPAQSDGFSPSRARSGP